MSRNERWLRYVKKTLTPITIRINKDVAQAFKDKCKEKNIPQAQVIKKAIENFIKE